MQKFIYLLLSLLFPAALWAQNGSTTRIDDPDAGRLFPYPVVPDSKITLDQRCNYLVYHFWDRANIKQSFSTIDKLREAFGHWASFMPHATADTVMLSINNYIKAVEKADAKRVPDMVKIAEHWFQGDSAEYASDALFLPFCQAGAKSKKTDAATRARYARRAKILESSGIGSRVPNLQFVDAEGNVHGLDDVLASRVVLFFADPDCTDCSLSKARLSADYNLKSLVDKGLVKVVVLYDKDSDWQQAAKSCPETWVTGASDSIDEYFDLITQPTIYYVDGRHRVLGKNMDVDTLLSTLLIINRQQEAVNP